MTGSARRWFFGRSIASVHAVRGRVTTDSLVLRTETLFPSLPQLVDSIWLRRVENEFAGLRARREADLPSSTVPVRLRRPS